MSEEFNASAFYEEAEEVARVANSEMHLKVLRVD